MGQYYLPYVKRGSERPQVFSNKVSGDYNGLKLMEHSWFHNYYVGNVINDLFYNKAHVCWVGDYYYEDDYDQVNCDKETVKKIGEAVWQTNDKYEVPSIKENVRFLHGCLLVNHTKKCYIVCDDYQKINRVTETWEDREYECCVNPLPLLTCSASHSGGSYYGINKENCGIWFNDVIEVVLASDSDELDKNGYCEIMFEFKE